MSAGWLPEGALLSVERHPACPNDWSLVVTLVEGPQVAGSAHDWIVLVAAAWEAHREAALAVDPLEVLKARRKVLQHLAEADDARTKIRARARAAKKGAP